MLFEIRCIDKHEEACLVKVHLFEKMGQNRLQFILLVFATGRKYYGSSTACSW